MYGEAEARSAIASGIGALATACRDNGRYQRATELREMARLVRATNELERGQAAVRLGLQLTREAWRRVRGEGQLEINVWKEVVSPNGEEHEERK